MRLNKIESRDNRFLAEMAKAGEFTTGGICYEVEVYPNEGPIPHFHLHNSSENSNKKDICIRFDSPEYFVHGSYKSKLNSTGRKDLIKFLISEDEYGVSNWEFLRRYWNRSFPDNRISSDEMPNYRLLPDKS